MCVSSPYEVMEYCYVREYIHCNQPWLLQSVLLTFEINISIS